MKGRLKEKETAKLLCRDERTIYQAGKQGTVEFRNSDLSVRKEYSSYLRDKTQKSITALDKLEREYKDKFSLILKGITVYNGVEYLDMAGLEKSVYNKLSI